MHSVLAKLVALVVVLGGFAVTGDLGRLFSRGVGLLNATSIPTGREPGQALPPVFPAPRPVVAAPMPSSLKALDIRSLPPGARFTVWTGSPPVETVFDVVDPAAGQVLERARRPDSKPAAPRRLVITGDASRPTLLTVGATLRLIPTGIASAAHAAHAVETLGPVRALDVR